MSKGTKCDHCGEFSVNRYQYVSLSLLIDGTSRQPSKDFCLPCLKNVFGVEVKDRREFAPKGISCLEEEVREIVAELINAELDSRMD